MLSRLALPRGGPQLKDTTGSFVGILPDAALPEADHRPASLLGELCRTLVPLTVATHLLLPQRSVGAREGPLPAVDWAAMPVVAVDEDSNVIPGEDEVGRAAGCQPPVQPEPGTSGM